MRLARLSRAALRPRVVKHFARAFKKNGLALALPVSSLLAVVCGV